MRVRVSTALSQGRQRPDENLVKKNDTISSAGRFNLHGDGEFSGRRAIGLTCDYNEQTV
jgi:hypothetical protein